MLRNILILTVSILSLQSMSYAADNDKLMSNAVSAITQQTVVVSDHEVIANSSAPAVITTIANDHAADTPAPAKAKKTTAQKIKSFFANLFICLKATNEVVNDVANNAHAISDSVTQTVQNIKDISTIKKS